MVKTDKVYITIQENSLTSRSNTSGNPFGDTYFDSGYRFYDYSFQHHRHRHTLQMMHTCTCQSATYVHMTLLLLLVNLQPAPGEPRTATSYPKQTRFPHMPLFPEETFSSLRIQPTSLQAEGFYFHSAAVTTDGCPHTRNQFQDAWQPDFSSDCKCSTLVKNQATKIQHTELFTVQLNTPLYQLGNPKRDLTNQMIPYRV